LGVSTTTESSVSYAQNGLLEIICSRYFLQDFYVFYFQKQRFEVFLVCVSAKSYSLTLYEFFNRQDLSAIETERNAVFYSKHTAGSPI
jgi:hypothetical protein